MTYHEALEEVCIDLSLSELIEEARRMLKRDECGQRAPFVADVLTQYDERDSIAPGQKAAIQRIVAYQWAKQSREDEDE